MTSSERPSRRAPITLIVLGVASTLVALTFFYGRGSVPPATTGGAPAAAPATTDGSAGAPSTPNAAGPAADPAAAPGAGAGTSAGGDSPAGTAPADGASGQGGPSSEIAAWRATAPGRGLGALEAPSRLGSLDPRRDRLQATLAGRAAGFSSIEFSDFWETAAARRQAAAHWRAVESGKTETPPLPPEDLRYVLQGTLPLTAGTTNFEVPLLAVHSLEVDGVHVSLFGDVWSEESPGVFVTEIRDAAGATMLRVTRTVTIGGGGYDLHLAQRVENRSGRPLALRWVQYGPPELRVERSRYIDARRFHFGYLLPPSRDPSQRLVIAETDHMIDLGTVIKAVSRGDHVLWPNASSREDKLAASWFGSTNRYFAMAVHAPDPLGGTLSMEESAQEVHATVATRADGSHQVLTELHSAVVTVAAGGTGSFDLGVFAGPLDPRLLDDVEPYRTLGLGGLIVYLISGCCSFCTFAWLAKLLLAFLTLLHDYVVFDWGLAIIALVIVVRTILHPITKRAQISLQQSTKAMAELRPEMEKLQQRYRDDPTRLQQETMRLYREKKINPIGCATGLLPTFLQMPIWIALYAMLYFAFQLRQEPAFFGVFQLFGGWPFLADLSAADHFFGEFSEPRTVLFFTLSGINLLPILMGVVFYIQQKYLTPPSAVPLSPEQEQQQKIMKFMMVVLFPVMMYTAPSGLTLYWLTSSLIGIFEVQLIRRHIKQAELKAPAEKPRKRQDWLGRMYEQAMRRAQERQEQRRNPPKRFKERE